MTIDWFWSPPGGSNRTKVLHSIRIYLDSSAEWDIPDDTYYYFVDMADSRMREEPGVSIQSFYIFFINNEIKSTFTLDPCVKRYGSANPHWRRAIWIDEEIPTTCNWKTYLSDITILGRNANVQFLGFINQWRKPYLELSIINTLRFNFSLVSHTWK